MKGLRLTLYGGPADGMVLTFPADSNITSRYVTVGNPHEGRAVYEISGDVATFISEAEHERLGIVLPKAQG